MNNTQTGRITLPGSPLGVAWAFLYGYFGIPAATYMPQLRALGAGFTKVYLFWNQIEPEKGRYDWSAVDAFVNQLESPEEGLIAIFSASKWATRTSSEMLPPSPARNPEDYYRFIHDLARHCKGRVRYWQNDAEPNNPIFWAGTKEDFVAGLKLFYRAVKDADPEAVILAGGHDGMFVPPSVTTMPPFPTQEAGLAFFDHVFKEGDGAFDIFDLRLYGDPYTIVPRVDFMREKMLALGYEKPIVCAEYGGPSLFQFPVNRQYRPWVSAWSEGIAEGNVDLNPVAPEIAHLYETMDSLPPETQMFMLGCPPGLEAKLERIQARELVMRNLFAFSAGVQKTLYWQLLQAHGDRNNLMTLMFGKIGMIGSENGALTQRFPLAEVYARMTEAFHGLEQVTRIEVPSQPEIYLFRVERGLRGPLHVVWERRDTFTGEDAPLRPFHWDWKGDVVSATDALGQQIPAQIRDGEVYLPISVTPVYLENCTRYGGRKAPETDRSMPNSAPMYP
jgi:hypothetical protein